MSNQTDIDKWVGAILDGTGGFVALCQHEGVNYLPIEAMRFVIRCLANPDCEGAAEVLAAIHMQRVEKVTGVPPMPYDLSEIAMLVRDVASTADSFGVPMTASILRANAEELAYQAKPQ